MFFKNFLSFRPLHLSSRNGLVEVTRELLQKGASVSIIDNEGLTPALCCAPSVNVAHCLALILKNLLLPPDTNNIEDKLAKKNESDHDHFLLALVNGDEALDNQ